MWAVNNWLKQNWLKSVFIIIVLVAIIAGLLIWHNKSTVKPPHSLLSPQVQAANQSQATQKWLSQKNYQNAATTCAGEASANSGTGNYAAAKATLQSCIKAIPETDVPYFLYDSLSNVAKKLDDTNLQKDSIQKALAKAQQPNSGADPALITFYNQELASLK